MDAFLGTCNTPKLSREGTGSLNRPMTSEETGSVMKSLPAQKSPGPDVLMGEFYQMFKEELIPSLLKTLLGN